MYNQAAYNTGMSSGYSSSEPASKRPRMDGGAGGYGGGTGYSSRGESYGESRGYGSGVGSTGSGYNGAGSLGSYGGGGALGGSGGQMMGQSAVGMRGAGSLSAGAGGRVVHVRNLADGFTEADIIDAFQNSFGNVSYINFVGVNEADVEFEVADSAQQCLQHALSGPVFVLNQPTIVSASSQPILQRKRGESDKPTPVLYMQILNPRFEINVTVINEICKTVAPITRIAIQRQASGSVEAFVEFPSITDARQVKYKLNGCDIYSGCCTLKIEYANMDRVIVAQNGTDSWDYTAPAGGMMRGGAAARMDSRPSLLQDPNAQQGYGGGMGGGPMGGGPGGPYGGPPMQGPQAGGYGPGPGGPPMGAPMGPPIPDGTGLGMPEAVLMIYGLNPEKMNCDRLFNLLCLYGNVVKIKFLKSKPDTAMVQMGDPCAAERTARYLNRTVLFGNKLSVNVSKQPFLNDVMNPVELSDNSPSFKDYSNSRNNRYVTADAAAKNRLVEPMKTLYFFNSPPNISQETITEAFEKANAPTPIGFKMFPSRQDQAKSSAGTIEFNTEEEAVDALVLANHTTLDNPNGKYPYIMKLSFAGTPNSPSGAPGGGSFGGYGGPPRGGYGGGGPMQQNGRGFGDRGARGGSFRGGDRGGRGGGFRGGDRGGSRGGGRGGYGGSADGGAKDDDAWGSPPSFRGGYTPRGGDRGGRGGDRGGFRGRGGDRGGRGRGRG